MDGYVEASGKWTSPGNVLKPHSVVIQCRIDSKECIEAKAEIAEGAPIVSVQNYQVIQWNKDGIVAEDSSPICLTARLIINFQEKSVTGIDTPKKDAKGMPLGDGRNACQLAANHTQIYTLTE